MSSSHPSRTYWTLAVVWVTALIVISYWVLNSHERGSGMGFGMLMVFGSVFLGIPCLAYALIKGGQQMSLNRPITLEVAVAAWISVTVATLFVLRIVGSRWYLQDQVEAKAFVEQRLALAKASAASGGAWPQTQPPFVGTSPLPRLLQLQRYPFYTSDGRGRYDISIPVDFDGGWHLSDHNPQWRRSS